MRFSLIMGCLLGVLALGAVSTDYSGTALAEESIKAACPTCVDKDVLRKGMGMTPLEKTMSCPDCKDKGTEHACEKCSLEQLNCPKCKKVVAAVEREPARAACPSCGEKVILSKGMGVMPLEKSMSCPDCKDKGIEHACEKCSLERLNCSKCKKAIAAVEREPARAVCSSCGEKTTLSKGMGIMPLEKAMSCPDCKGKDAAHVCKTCSEETLACPRCKGA